MSRWPGGPGGLRGAVGDRARAAGRARPDDLGIAFGDIGTQPLYAFRESFLGHGAPLPATPVNVLGILSLIFWALIVVISIKTSCW